MLENNWSLKILAGAAGVTLALGLAVSVGAVPQLGDDGSVRTAAVSQADEVGTASGAAATQTTTPAPAATTPPTTAAPTSVAPTTPTTKVTVTTKAAAPTTKAPATTRTTQAPAASAAAPTPTPTPAAAAASTAVPRRTPSAAEVQSVITQLKQQVGGILMLVSPTPAQIAQAGDQICTAFDNGQTFAQVKATGLSMIPASITVSPATADWAVRNAVALYCPGHANKLV